MYSDNPGPAEDSSMAEAGQAEGKSAHGDDGETAVLPKSILAGKHFDPGDEVVLKVVAIHDDSVEVAYATGEGDHKEGEHEMGNESTPEQEPSGGGPSGMYE